MIGERTNSIVTVRHLVSRACFLVFIRPLALLLALLLGGPLRSQSLRITQYEFCPVPEAAKNCFKQQGTGSAPIVQ